MSCSDHVNPSTIEFVAYGIKTSEIGQYKTMIEISVPSNASKSILEISLFNKTLSKYDYSSIHIPIDGDCSCVPNCIVQTKLYNSKLYYVFNFNALIKGHEYTLSYCLKYNKDPSITTV